MKLFVLLFILFRGIPAIADPTGFGLSEPWFCDDDNPGIASHPSCQGQGTPRLMTPAPWQTSALAEGRDTAAFAGDMQARRELAWEILSRVLQPLDQDRRDRAGWQEETGRLPLFYSWYSSHDLRRLVHQGAAKLAAEPGCHTDQGMTAACAEQVLAGYTRVRSPAFDPVPAYLPLRSLGTLSIVLAEGVYNKDYTLYVLQNLRRISTCARSTDLSRDCGIDFPRTAVMLKPVFQAVGDAPTCVPFDEDTLNQVKHNNLLRGLTGKDNWPRSQDACGAPWPEGAHRIRDPASGRSYGLIALHVVTKDLPDWVWITLMWNGAAMDPVRNPLGDQPGDWGGVEDIWRHYGMMVTVAAVEGDPDPGTANPVFAPKFINGPTGKAITWNSNPWIEPGDPASNCLSCHRYTATGGQALPETPLGNYDYTFGIQWLELRFQELPEHQAWTSAEEIPPVTVLGNPGVIQCWSKTSFRAELDTAMQRLDQVQGVARSGNGMKHSRLSTIFAALAEPLDLKTAEGKNFDKLLTECAYFLCNNEVITNNSPLLRKAIRGRCPQ